MPIVAWGARARPVAVLSAALLLCGCLGDGAGSADASAPADASCSPTMNGDASIAWPALNTGDGAHQFTLVPSPTQDDPAQYVATRAAVDATLACPQVAFDPAGSSPLVASNVDRMGQSLTISFRQLPGSNATVFTKTGGSLSGGILGGTAGDDLNPLVNAAVSIYDTTGAKVLATGSTNEYGSLVVAFGTLPDNFKVIATGGTMFGKPFVGTLKAEVEGYTTIEANPSITLTPVTTFVAAVRERSPGLSLDEAMQRVKSGLRLPERLDIDASDQGASDYFDSAAFYAAADAAGGVDALVQSVLSDWDQGVSHDFVPVAATDRQEPSVLMKGLLPPEELPNYKDITLGDIGTGASVVGKLWSVYSAYKTREWQASVVADIARINAEIKNIKSDLGDLKERLNSTGYDLAYSKVEKWRSVVTPAFGALHWLAANPQRNYKPANETCPDPMPAASNRAGLSPGCDRYAKWLDAAAASAKTIKNVIRPFDLNIDDDIRETLAEIRGAPIARFREGMSGTTVNTVKIDGMLQIYRRIVFDRRTGNAVASQRLFFRPEDSEDIWDHYRYWESLQAQTYLFIADYLESTGQDASGLHADYKAALAAEKDAMPLRQMPALTAIDPVNRRWNGAAITGDPINGVAVGGPMMWMYPALTVPCSSGYPITFDNDNVQVQGTLGTFFNCMNTNATAGKGLTGWRMPTYLEWQTFTLTEGTPNPGSQGYGTVGDWMAARGFTMRGFDGTLVYAAAPGCSGSVYYNGKYFTCGDFKVYFQLISGQWRPFMYLNKNHTPDRYTQTGSAGYVFPVRPVSANEYW